MSSIRPSGVITVDTCVTSLNEFSESVASCRYRERRERPSVGVVS